MFRVGVTGHRPNRMPEGQWQRIRKDIDKVMADIEVSNPNSKPALLSGLAEGADRLAAFIALGRGWPLHAVLAFHRARFEGDFPEPFARGELRALLTASETIEEPAPSGQTRGPAEEGYDIVAQRLLSLSNVLIAVWDGEASRGLGGTVSLIEKALVKGIPIVWVHASESLPPRNLQSISDARP